MSTSTGSDILTRILKRKKEEISERRARVTLAQLKAQVASALAPRGFFFAISKAITAGKSAVIAEIKKA